MSSCSFADYSNKIQSPNEKCTYLCGSNILLVDDENMNISVAYCLIATLGIHPLVCSSGAMALKVFEHKLTSKCCQNRVELILTDI